MTHTFDDSVRTAVLHHMNDDHSDDNLLIARAFGPAGDPASATMTGLDGDGGEWIARLADGTEVSFRVPWPGGAISERPEVRREIVALYDAACERLGIEPRPHA
ncbi:DUF2470 domain-containing protein [Microbacterium sp. NPDC055910]|uniref:DUF2470 domain-containing protein n=1 Tax=Microbacterium sp. NPDC055910 TaxID=3345659 RepID=UPI0035DEBDA4